MNALAVTSWAGGIGRPPSVGLSGRPIERTSMPEGAGGLVDAVELLAAEPTRPTDEAARIARIRREIADGAYDTPDKLDVVVSRLIHVLRTPPLVDKQA